MRVASTIGSRGRPAPRGPGPDAVGAAGTVISCCRNWNPWSGFCAAKSSRSRIMAAGRHGRGRGVSRSGTTAHAMAEAVKNPPSAASARTMIGRSTRTLPRSTQLADRRPWPRRDEVRRQLHARLEIAVPPARQDEITSSATPRAMVSVHPSTVPWRAVYGSQEADSKKRRVQQFLVALARLLAVRP